MPISIRDSIIQSYKVYTSTMRSLIIILVNFIRDIIEIWHSHMYIARSTITEDSKVNGIEYEH